MRKFLAQRFVFAMLSLVAATLIVFVLSRMAGDPLLLYAKPGGYGMSEEQIAALSEKLALNRPLIVQYFIWLGRVITGDFGVTLLAERDVRTVVFEKLGATIQLGIAAFALATLIGIPLGVLSAIARGTVWDYFGRTFALLGQATPAFFMGIVGILVFAVTLDWLPPGGRPVDESFWPHQVRAMAMPMATLGLLPAASYLRLTRSSMLEVLDSEFVKLARAKGSKCQHGDLETRIQERANPSNYRLCIDPHRIFGRFRNRRVGVRLAWGGEVSGRFDPQQRLPAADRSDFHVRDSLRGGEFLGRHAISAN